MNLGDTAPSFSLPATDGNTYALADYSAADVLVVVFTCNHCPYAVALQGRVADFARAYADRNVRVVAICSNDPVRYPADNFDAMRARAQQEGFPFPYLHDATQEVARAYDATCTPDFFVFDADHTLAYRGRFDDNWRDPDAVTQRDLPAAVDALLAGARPAPEQAAAVGCSIKWKY
ncbi:MAG: thioredoxin family protein [Myxococcota bacterium]